MTRLVFGLALLFTALAQASVLPAVNVLGIGPNLVMVLILIWSAMRGVPEGLLWAFPLGLLLDLLAVDPLGSNGLSLMAVAVIGGLASRRLFHSGVIVPMALVLLATVVHQIIGVLVATALGSNYSFGISLRLSALIAFLNVVMVPIVYFAVLVVDRVGVRYATRR